MSLSSQPSADPSIATYTSAFAGVTVGLVIVYSLIVSNSHRATTTPALHRSNAVHRRHGSRSNGRISDGDAAVVNGTHRGPEGDGAAPADAVDRSIGNDATQANGTLSRTRAQDVPQIDGAFHIEVPESDDDVGAEDTPYSTADSADDSDNVTDNGLPEDEDAEQVAANSDSVASASTRATQVSKELLFAISDEKWSSEHRVHRIVGCDNCHQLPIRGIRWKCLNCADFDLCSQCEMRRCHPSTHVFVKIKVPVPRASFFVPTPAFYPGTPSMLPLSLPGHVKKMVLKNVKATLKDRATRMDEEMLKQYYERFTHFANVDYRNDSCGLGRGIDQVAFNKLIPFCPRPGVLTECTFKFFDTREHGVIGFEELVMGSTILFNTKSMQRELIERSFRALDVDSDGYVSREDLLRVFRGYHEFNQDLVNAELQTDNEAEVLEDHPASNRDPRSFILSSGSLGAAYREFSDGGPYFTRNLDLQHEKKALDNEGVPIAGIDETTAIDRSYLSLEEELRDILRRSITPGLKPRVKLGREVRRMDPNEWPDALLVADNSGIFIQVLNKGMKPTPMVKLDPKLDSDLIEQYNLIMQIPDPEQKGKHFEETVLKQLRKRCFNAIMKARQEHLRTRHKLRHSIRNEVLPARYADETDAEVRAHNAVYFLGREAFNSMIDSIFAEREAVDARALRTAPLRELLAQEIQTLIDFTRHSGNADFPLDAGPEAEQQVRRRRQRQLAALRALHPSAEQWQRFCATVRCLQLLGWTSPDDVPALTTSRAALDEALAQQRARLVASPQLRVDDLAAFEETVLDGLAEITRWEHRARLLADEDEAVPAADGGSAAPGKHRRRPGVMSKTDFVALMDPFEGDRARTLRWLWEFLFLAV